MVDYAIIVAGGSGTRMGTALPKQFLELAGKPVLVHTMEKFHRFNPAMKIILVLPEEYIQFWDDLRRTIGFAIEHTVVAGGKERFFSVKNALDTIHEDSCIVGIHDAVRPLVSLKTLESAYHTARERSTAVPVIAIHDSIREVDEMGNNHAVNRRAFRIIQTPQCFELNTLV
jgi:2-C-methyl-D-erythritol 4-phosphate cytidylyltransferase